MLLLFYQLELRRVCCPLLYCTLSVAIKWPQGSSGRRVRGEELFAARESVRLEAQRLFFPGFLDSSDGQDFIVNALQDGTLGPAEVRGPTHGAFVTRAHSLYEEYGGHTSQT